MCLTQIIGLSLCRLAEDVRASPRATRTKAYNYKRADFDSLRAALRLVHWAMLSDCSVDDAVPMFCDFAFAEGKTFQQCVSNPSKLQKTDRKKNRKLQKTAVAMQRVVLCSLSPQSVAGAGRRAATVVTLGNSHTRRLADARPALNPVGLGPAEAIALRYDSTGVGHGRPKDEIEYMYKKFLWPYLPVSQSPPATRPPSEPNMIVVSLGCRFLTSL